MAWLLDTNILSEIRKPRPEQKVVIFVSGTHWMNFTSVR